MIKRFEKGGAISRMVQRQNGSKSRKTLIYIGFDKTIIRIVEKYQENEKIMHELTSVIKFFD